METSYQIEKKKAYKLLEETFTKDDKRYHHILEVAKKAISLANIYNICQDKAEIAAIMHDICKYYNKEDAKKILSATELKECEENEAYYHAYLASYLYLDKVGTDLEIASAIKYHVNGHKNMTKLEEIILISDYIEDSRTYINCIKCRNLVNKGLFYSAIYYSTYFTKMLHSKDKPHKYLDEVLECYKEKMMKEKLNLLKEACLKVNASDICCYDTKNTSPFFDYVIVASVSSNRQLQAVKSYVEEYFKDTTFEIKHAEGQESNWVLIDCFDVILNVFTQEERARINFDELFKNNDNIAI